MIDWMQRHKKYLLITIWVSTIAFIGAGSTGWGDYNLSRSSDVVASVGDEDIKYVELNSEYNRIFSAIKQKNPNFDNESAKKINLQKKAMENVISRKYLLNYAKDINLISTQSEIVKAIVENKLFFVDGKFSKINYKNILKQNNLTPELFEKQVAEGILIEKVLNIFKTQLSSLEAKISDINTKLEDKVNIVVLDSKNIKIKPTTKQLKDFWEKTKNRYITKKKYALSVVEIKFGKTIPSEQEIQEYYANNKLKFEDENGEIKSIKDSKKQIIKEINKEKAQEKAKKMYYDVKNNKIKTTKKIHIDRFSFDAFREISKYKKGDYFKPIQMKDKYIVGKLQDVIQPRVMTYKEARKKLSFALVEKLKLEKLEKKAKKTLKNFKGKRVGFVSKENYFEKLKKYNLDRFESNNFIFKLMNSSDKKGYFVIDKKVIVYKVLSQRLPKNTNETIKLNSFDELKNITKNDDTLLNIKNMLIQNSVLNYFRNKYKVEYFVNIENK